VIYTSRATVEAEELEPGPIRAASLRVDGRSFIAVRHEGKDGSVHYFDESGQPPGNFFFRYPVQYTQISSMFSAARFPPVLGQKRPHDCVDFAAPVGTPVRFVADGVAVSAGLFGYAGNMVKI